MKSSRRRPAAYTLIEVLVAMGVIALAIGAASQLCLSQSLTEEVNQKETMAVNFGENNARLWQLGVTPSNFLPASPNSTSGFMTCSISSPSTVNGGEDYTINPISVDSVTVTVAWLPPGKASSTSLTFTALRNKPERR